MRTPSQRQSPIEHADAVGVIVALLDRYPHVATLSSDPVDRTVTLSFAISGSLEKAVERELRETIGDHVRALLGVTRDEPDRLTVELDADDELSFLRVTRDARSLSRDELGMLTSLLAARFAARLVHSAPQSDAEIDEDPAAQDELVDYALDALRDPASQRSLVGFREEMRRHGLFRQRAEEAQDGRASLMLVDFHSHTLASDGALEPAALVASMKKRGVQIFSITDHDSLDAYDAVGTEIEGHRVVVGIEINTTYKGNEVHILGYGLPLGDSVVRRTIDSNRVARTERAVAMVTGLRRAGYEISLDDVKAQAGPDAALGRPHVAKALVHAGATKSVETAFRDFLTPGRPGYVPSHHIRPHDAIAAIAKSGGVPVLAHPGRLHDEEIIDEMVEAGIAGLEVFYRTHRPGQVQRYREIAAEHGLVMTAGSDFHDYQYSPAGVGMEVDEADVRPFLDLVLD